MDEATRTTPRGSAPELKPLFQSYRAMDGVYDEVVDPEQRPRAGVTQVVRLLDQLGEAEFRRRQHLADSAFLRGGITFSVYSSSRGKQNGVEKIFPFDSIPRVIPAADWEPIEKGLAQRVQALNLFLADIYGEQRILKEGRIPREIVLGSRCYEKKARGVLPPGGVRVVVAGIDLVRGADGRFVVLEDNVRTPSGVSYVIENRQVMKRIFPRIFARSRVRGVQEYPQRLRQALSELAPAASKSPRIVVLTPGSANSAYFEHSFLARSMGCDLVHGSDLFVHEDRVYVKTTSGPSPVDVIYRRLDDAFLDPKAFRKDSLLGVPGLFRAYAKGNVALVNAVGNGVADDKAIYPFVPDMIRFYLSEEPILGQVETYICSRPDDRKRVLADLGRMVVKSVNESGGYGMLMGPKASLAERGEFAEKIRSDPRNFIAQPLIELSTCPTWTRRGLQPRRVDLRPYIVTGKSTWVLPGGLTRVALVQGSYVVNSSQGGGSKDTWVLEGRETAP